MLITKFQLRERMFGDIFYSEENDLKAIDEFMHKCNSPVHPDLLKALNAIKPHVAVLMGWQTALLNATSGDLEGITMHSVDFGNRGQVIISFKFSLPGVGYLTTIKMPKIDFSLDEPNYKYMKKLKACVDRLYERVEGYANKEYGDGEQLAIQFQNDDAKKEDNKELSTHKSKEGQRALEAV